jgi:hypothetical protein
VLAALVAIATVSGGSIAGAEEPGVGTPTGGDAAALADPELLRLPELGFAHRRPDGGIDLFRMPLSELEEDVGTASRVDTWGELVP